MNNGYIEVYCPDNPRSNKRSNKKTGFVYLHVLQAEKKIGRYLNEKECVHHMDGNKTNNNPDNLIIFRTGADHSRFHRLKNPQIHTFEDGISICYGEKCKKKKYVKTETIRRNTIEYCNESKYKSEFYRIINTITIDDLIYSLLRMPFSEVAKSLNISDSYLIKMLRKLDLPCKSSYYRNEAKSNGIKYYNGNILSNSERIKIYNDDFKKKLSQTLKNKAKNNGGLKLKYEDVLIIKSSNEKQDKLAERFNVSKSTISRIKNGIIW